ncbi:MAG TPA: hypothetical protein DDX14_10365 [Cyanobacteria bacterium UBA9579]|nr:hypothetical protein [Cyanobacteria bacterium UBA9579]
MGSTNAKISDLVIPGTNILGARFGTLGAANNSSIVPRIIAGRAEDNTQVELFINGVYTDKQAVQNGRFEFDSLNYPSGSFVKIKVEQVNQDNTRKVVYDRDFSQDKDLLAPGQKEYLVFSGIDNSITRHKFTLLGKGSQNYYQEPMRFSTGAKYKMGITPKLTAGVNLAHSRNLGNSSTPFFISGGSTPRIIRQSRSTSGTVASTDFNYNPTENLKLSSETAVSSATSASQYEPNSVDIGSFVSFDYTKPDYHLYGKAFSYGPNFYSAGFSDTTDKRGGELSGNWSVGPLNLSGSAIKYNSNLDNMFYGGLSNISNYNVYLSGPIDDNASIRAGIRSNTAENSIYNDSQTNFDLTLNRKLYKNADLSVNYVHTISSSDNYETRTRSAMSNDRINASLNIDANKVGVFRLSHDITMLTPEEKLIISGMNNYNYEPPVYKNLYLRLDRSRQPIKGFTFSPSTGYRYGGDNKGILLGANLGYILKSGRQIMLNYNYNSTFARYLNSGMSIGGNNAHALSVNFIDTLNFGLGNTAQANNQFIYNQDSGIIKGCVYLDLNQNGAKDEGEEGVPDIEITIKSMYTVATDKKGNYVAPNLSDRVYVIGIEKNTLPVIYAPTGNDVAVNVKRSKVYVANLGLIVTPGSISGKVEVNKENANNSEVIILLLDKDNKEIKYTTTDSTGGYYIGSIPPGEYRVVVDKNYLDYNGLQEQEGEHKVSVPLVTDDFVDIEGIDFKLIEKTAEVKTF